MLYFLRLRYQVPNEFDDDDDNDVGLTSFCLKAFSVSGLKRRMQDFFLNHFNIRFLTCSPISRVDQEFKWTIGTWQRCVLYRVPS